MIAEGMDEDKARGHIYILDSKGLLHRARTNLSEIQFKYAQPYELVLGWKGTEGGGEIRLAELIKNISATILIGVSSQPNTFTESIVKEMARKVDRPIIFPLSNPSDRAEAAPKDVIQWTEGRALIATGTEFPPVSFKGKTFKIAQCNNFYIFPAIGLAVIACEARRVTDKMLIMAARALSDFQEGKAYNDGSEDGTPFLLPPIEKMKEVAIYIAIKAALQAQQDGIAPQMSEQKVSDRVQKRFWIPQYRNYYKVAKMEKS
jgi:malate dehydrogenase (oxaloacetate-decarboxylating)